MEKKTNEDLVRLFKDTGNEDYLAELINRNMGIIYNAARSFVETTHIDIEDLVQEGIIELYRAAMTYEDGKSKFSTYLGVYLKKHYINLYTATTRQKRQTQSPLLNIDELDCNNMRVTAVECKELDEVEVMEFVDSLSLTPTEYVIVKNLMLGYPKKDIAEMLKCSRANIAYYIKQIRKKYRLVVV